jgi:ATP-dependent DNA helicase RecG
LFGKRPQRYFIHGYFKIGEFGSSDADLNAIVHKDYTDTTIQLSVYDDKMMLWNPGKLPVDIPLERLTKKHPSRPRNKHIAEAFFRAGYIESWGRGIEKILTAFQEAGSLELVFEVSWGRGHGYFSERYLYGGVSAET